MAKNKISVSKRIKILNKYNSRCAYCGCELNYDTLNVDHIIPAESNHLNNLNPSCRSCNSSKSTKSLDEFKLLFISKKLKIPRFNNEQKSYLCKQFNIDIDLTLSESGIKFYYEELNG